jgi:hypothetical protein
LSKEIIQRSKQRVWSFWQALETADDDHIVNVCAAHAATDAAWHGPEPVNGLQGPQTFARDFWLPFRHTFSGPRRDSLLFFGGRSSGRRDGHGDGRMCV